jgi:uncharacterized RDD family membrane protein YckC
MSAYPPQQGGVPPYVPPPYQPQGSMYDPMQQQAAAPAYATFWLRFAAVLLDGLILGIPLAIILFAAGIYRTSGVSVTRSILSSLISAVIYLLYEGLMLSFRNGQTLGKQIVKIRVVPKAGGTLTMQQAFTRAGVKALLSVISSIRPPYTSFLGIIGLLNYLSMLWDSDKQCWHDKAAGTIVVLAS